MKDNYKKAVLTFTLALIFIAIAGGLSSSNYSNYFKEAYNVTSVQRGFIEIPRETPGILCMFAVSILGGLGNIWLAIISQILVCIGVAGMGLLSPSYAVMLSFLFINSFGQHLFMPLNDSISMSLAKEGEVGTTMGKFKAASTISSMVTAAIVFIGFKTNIFSFKTKIIVPFVIALGLSFLAMLMLFKLKSYMPNEVRKKKFKLLFRKQYLPYYLLTFAYGAQKRIRLVFAPWVLIEILHKGADTLALLMIITYFAGSFFAPILGKILDKKGIKFSLILETVYIIVSFCAMGTLASALVGKSEIQIGYCIAIYGLYILCDMFEQFNMVHSFLMRKLAINSEEVTESLAVGLSVDHVVAVIVSALLGLVWAYWGVAITFYISAAFSLIQLYVAFTVKVPTKVQK